MVWVLIYFRMERNIQANGERISDTARDLLNLLMVILIQVNGVRISDTEMDIRFLI